MLALFGRLQPRLGPGGIARLTVAEGPARSTIIASISSTAKKDSILATGQAVTFTQLLFGHTIEGMYSVPEYGGNANLVGWQDIKWPGDIQPRGYTDAEVEGSAGDMAAMSGIIGLLVRGGWMQAVAKMGGQGGVNA